MIRLCFERIPGNPSIDRKPEFLAWLNDNFSDQTYRAGGSYIVTPLSEQWYGSNPLWFILIDDGGLDVLAEIERQGWVIDGYAIHAYHRANPGDKEIKIPNDHARVARRDQTVSLA
jgi:hypothetical protein